MFLPAALSVLAVVALGPQVVLGSFKFKLSPVVQCEPVNITFSGDDANNHSVPTTLTILPLTNNALPIKIVIPNGSSNSTGIQLNFIPLPKDTLFIASLDDIEGPLAKVSDVTKVAAPTDPAAAATCFGSGTPSANFYNLADNPSQCETFTVAYTINAPSIRAFLPRIGSTQLAQLSSTGVGPGTATYMMNVTREEEVVLLFDDGQEHLQTMGLITIGGDSSSSTSCFIRGNSKSNSSVSKAKSSALPQAAAIGIAVAATIVGLVAILVLLYFLRERRRRRFVSDMEFDPALLNRRWSPNEKQAEQATPAPYNPTPSAALPPPFSAGGFVRDPIYTDEKYASSMISDARTSIGSWNQFIPADQRSTQFQDSPRFQQSLPRSPHSRPSSGPSINTLDIHAILQMATVYGDRTSTSSSAAPRELPQPSTAGTAATTFNIAKPAAARLVPMRRRTSDLPDVPVSLSRDASARAAAVAALPSGYAPSSYGPSSYMAYGDDDEHSIDQGIGGFPVPASRQPSNPRDTSESWGNVV